MAGFTTGRPVCRGVVGVRVHRELVVRNNDTEADTREAAVQLPLPPMHGQTRVTG